MPTLVPRAPIKNGARYLRIDAGPPTRTIRSGAINCATLLLTDRHAVTVGWAFMPTALPPNHKPDVRIFGPYLPDI